jgi:predicted DNA-binding transcriptional regulator AlpA
MTQLDRTHDIKLFSDREPDRLLNAKQVASMLNIRPKRVYDLGIRRVLLSPRTVRWKQVDVEGWIESRSRGER